MSETTEFDVVFVPGKQTPGKGPGYPGKNHILSKNPLTTRCGNFKPGGHEPAQEDADMCQKCLNYVAGIHPTGRARPMRDMFKGQSRR